MRINKSFRRGKIGLALTIILASFIAPAVIKGKVEAATGGYPWSGAVCVSAGQVGGKCPNYEWSINEQTRNDI